MQRKNWDAAEGEFQKSLSSWIPITAEVDFFMGTVIASREEAGENAGALFYFARAGTY